MSAKKVTYKDIAKVLGVSSTTVHRALTGKSGVGDNMTAKIKKLAKEMGYHKSHMAAALKKSSFNLAVVFPEPTMDNRYYYLSLWNGVRKYFNEIPALCVNIMEFPYPLLPDSNGTVLKDLYEKHKNSLDGLITIAVDNSQSSYFLEKLSDGGIPIVVIGADLYKNLALCSVMAYDEMVGSLAAELITAFCPSDFSSRILVTGNPVGRFSMLDQYYNAAGFQRYLSQNVPCCSLLTAYSADSNAAGMQIRNYLKQYHDIHAIYSTSARNTVLMSEIVQDMGLAGKIKLIGNDCFPESMDYLKKKVLTAIIDKKIEKQGFEAARILLEYAAREQYPKSPVIRIRPSVVMNSHFKEYSELPTNN